MSKKKTPDSGRADESRYDDTVQQDWNEFAGLASMAGLWAVHISAGVLQWPWLVAGFAIAALLIVAGSVHVREEDMAATALFTAVFFVASLIHIRVGPTSVHL